MPLVRRRDGGAERDLLVAVDGVDVELVVVDADPVVGVAGRDRDVDVGGQEVGHGGVEGVDGDVLEDEPGLVGPQDCPHQQDHEQQDEVEDEEAGAQPPGGAPALPIVLRAVLVFHREWRCGSGSGGCGGGCGEWRSAPGREGEQRTQ